MKKLLNSEINIIGKKILSVLTAIVIFVVSMPVADVSKNVGKIVKAIKASAAEDDFTPIKITNDECTINTYADLIRYSKSYNTNPGIYENVNVNIAINQTAGSLDGFVSIGTCENPFKAKISISDSYKDFNLNLDVPLFDYIDTSAEIVYTTNATNDNATINLSRINSNTNTNTPLFANHIVNTLEKTANFSVKINAYKEEDNDSTVHDFAGVVGSIDENAKVNLTVTNNTGTALKVKNSTENGNVGLACQTMGKNSSLDFTYNSTKSDEAVSVEEISASQYAGGIVGNMESGSQLRVNGDIKSTGITGTYAGGVVGYATDATVTFGDSSSINATVNGSTATGGVFGKFENSAENNEFDVSTYNIDCTLNGKNNGGLFGELKNSNTISINGNTTNENIKINRTATDKEIYGGLIGTYSSYATNNTLSVSDMIVKVDKTAGKASNYGGVIGEISGASYVNFNNVTVNANNCSSNVDVFGGLVGKVSGGFVDAQNVTIKTNGSFNGGGVVGNLNSGVMRLSGNTDLSSTGNDKNSMSGEFGQIVKTRGNQALVYAKSDWKLIRSSNSKQYYDDIYSWGEVLRFNDSNFNKNSVLTEDEINHTVTVKPAVTEISSVEDFAKLALNIQMNNGATTNNTLKFENITESKSSNLLSQTISLNDNIDLSGIGITGLTRDDGTNDDFTGTFNGNNKKISLAVGEPYGYRGNTDTKIENTEYANDKSTAGNGVIYRHQYIGLFAKTGAATFKDLTIGGKIKVDDNSGGMSIGYLSGQHTGGEININNVTVSKDDNDEIYLNSNGSAYTGCGGFIGKVTSGGTINIDGCTISPNINTKVFSTDNSSGGPFRIGGAIGEIVSTENAITVNVENSTKIGAVITNNSKGVAYNNPTYTGGFIGYIADGSGADINNRKINFTNVTVDGANITSGVSNSDTSAGGGLLGQSWNNVQVVFGDNSTNGITIENSNVTYKGTGNFAGLVTVATGYWQVNDININGITVNGESASSFGMLVNKGIWEDNSQRKALYLELENENAYKITSATLDKINTDATFDEFVADCSDFTIESNYKKNYDNSDICSNGNAVVSIHTSGDKVIMDGENCNTYQNQTGRDISNPNTRYYYNLDVIRDKVEKDTATDSEKLLLWSVNKYAHSSLSNYFTNPFENKNTIPSGKYDMTGYSYYPVDVSDVTVSSGAKFTFCNDKIKNDEKTTTDSNSQHYLMHCGLFRNVTGNLTVNGTSESPVTFSGNVGNAGDNCGALVCGTISTDSTTPVSVTVSGVTLDGIKINGFDSSSTYAPLLINKIVKNTTLNLSDVTTSSAYSNGETVATSLIGDVGEENADNLKLTFSGITLDGRNKTDVLSDLNTAYNTKKSIFTKATLLNKYQYQSGKNCSAVYNFKHEEDWRTDGTGVHNVTYGKEISGSVEYSGKQEKYVDTDDYTSPTDSNATAVYDDFSANFLPYVRTAYTDGSNNFHEIKVNHKAGKGLENGCGTYNDPYIIETAEQLELVAAILNEGSSLSAGGTVVNWHSDNYKSWCSSDHETYKYDADKSMFVNESNNSETKSLSDMQTALSTAYYKIDNNEGITLPDTFIGLGKSIAFKGVIWGAGNTITNESSNPLIYQSIGSVVKDLTVNVTADFSNKFKSVTANTTYETDGSSGKTPFYGGIFGIVNGGDNIIDNVSVTFNDSITINLTGDKLGNVAVGGYVGVVRYGGVIFRNMSGENIKGIKKEQNEKFCDVSGIKNNNVYLYFNPIIGRVIDGYAFTESNSYKPRENTTDSNNKPTMKNGTKNYSIADINTSAGKITFNDNTISVPDGQALFLMGCIAMSGAGCAKDSNSGYGNINNSEFSYTSNKMVRHGQYDNIGTNDDETNVDDFVNNVKSGDIDTNSKDTVPYIIYKYTQDSTTNTYSSSARSMTRIAFSIELTGTETYTLPDGFRGIGSLEKNSDNLQMKISRFDGKNCTVNLNMSYYTYEIGKDSTIKYDVYTDNTGKYGLGLFNSLINNDITISNLNISGSVISEIYKNENGDKAYGGNYYKDYKMLPVSGIIGGYKPDKKGSVTITNVNISGFDLESNYIAGGLIGYVNGKAGTLSINNCQSNGSGISATVGHYVGGMVGYVENNITVNITGDETNKSEFIINKINSIGDYASSSKWHDTFSAGGLIGYVNNCSYTTENMEITGDTIESLGVCGGIVGRAMSDKIATIDNCVVKGIDLCGSFVGGITGITRITTDIKNCKVIGDTNKNKMIAYNSAGGIFSFSMQKNCTIDNCLVENYIIKLTGEKDIAYPENVGGFVGKTQGGSKTLTIKNSKISDCNIQNQNALAYISRDDSGTGGVIGHCESGMQLYGYNVLLNNVNITNESDEELTSKAGYIAGRVEDEIKLIGFCINGVTFDKEYGTGANFGYVIYSDYDGICTKTGANKDKSTINNESDVSDIGNSPYATINPKQQIDSEKFLTGDGVSSTARTNIANDTSKYKNITDEKAKFKENGVYFAKLSDFNKETGAGIANNFPVLVVNDTNSKNITNMINSYIRLLTNENSFDYAVEDSEKKYNVDISRYKYSDNSFTKYTEKDTLKRENSRFKMTEEDYDNVNNQFTLIDVQYYAPGTTNIAYHLYVPVMVEKMLKFNFSAAALSGTTYNLESYKGKDGEPVMENYGTPVTTRITYSYQRTAQEWADAINNGENVLKNFGKSVTLTSGNTTRFFPDGTKFVLVDRNGYGKAYYYDLPENNGSTYSATLKFSDFKDESSTAFTPSVSLLDLLEKSADITITSDNDGNLVETENENEATVKINGKNYKRKTDDDTTGPFYKVTVTAKEGATDANGIVNTDEQYYLSIFTPNSDAYMINITLSCPNSLVDDQSIGTPTKKISGANDVIMIWGNLYTQTFTFKTTSSTPISETNNTVNAEMSTTISLNESYASQTKGYLSNKSINLYHAFVIDAAKSDDKGTTKGIKGPLAVNVNSYSINDDSAYKGKADISSVVQISADDNGKIKELLASGTEVKINCNISMEYSVEGIINQFPLKTETQDYGTTYSAISNIAYSTENLQSSSMFESSEYSTGIKYFREQAQSALTKLTYNVPNTNADDLTNLGVNGRDISNNKTIKAESYYDVSELAARNDAKQVKFTVKLMQKGDNGEYTEVAIGDYLRNLKVYNAKDEEITLVENSCTVHKEDVQLAADAYGVKTSFDVITDKEFEEKNYMYSNYRVVLTAELIDSSGNVIENSLATDYIVYTNAKICTEFIS